MSGATSRRTHLEFTLNFGLDIINGIRRLYLKGDRLARKGLDKYLHDGLHSIESV